MKNDIETLMDTFKIGYEAYETSRIEALEVSNMFHNRQYTSNQLNVLAERGQPAETFNIVKMFGRMLLGYYSTVVNTVKVNPVGEEDVTTAAILNDIIDYTFRTNNFSAEGDKIKLDCLLNGLMVSYVDVKKTGEKDEFGRPKYRIDINHVPSNQVVLDPMSVLEDYSDARYIHRFKWMSEDMVIKLFGKGKLKDLEAYYNHLNVDDAEFERTHNTRSIGLHKQYDNYLIVHAIITDDKDKTWSTYWSNGVILDTKEITHKEVKSPYRLHRLHTSDILEYYGIFREVIGTQHAINQALLKIQLMVNTQKALVEDGAVDDVDDFITAFNRVNAVIPVKRLAGIRIENQTREVLDLYTIIDRGLDRIQRVLSINDSFLGMAYASDSGAKVKLQQNASVVALRYITSKVEQFHRLLGIDIVNLIKQYYTANDVFRLADNYSANKWVEINKPYKVPVTNTEGQLQHDENGNPMMRNIYEEVIDPETGKPMEDENGNLVIAPIPTAETEISFTRADIEIVSVSYNDEDEKNQMVLEQFINGPVGNTMSSINPAGYFKAASLAIKNTKTKASLELSNILDETAKMVQQNAGMQQQMQEGQASGQMQPKQAVNQLSGK